MHGPIIDQLTNGDVVYHCRCGEYFKTYEELMQHYRVNNQ